jgi:hypothetical protein
MRRLPKIFALAGALAGLTFGGVTLAQAGSTSTPAKKAEERHELRDAKQDAADARQDAADERSEHGQEPNTAEERQENADAKREQADTNAEINSDPCEAHHTGAEQPNGANNDIECGETGESRTTETAEQQAVQEEQHAQQEERHAEQADHPQQADHQGN